MVVLETEFVELRLELTLEDLCEDVLEATVVSLEDRVLGGEIDRILPCDSVVEGGTSEVADRIIQVVHRHRDARAWELEDLELHRRRAILWLEGHSEGSFTWNLEVSGAVLITECVAADDDGLGPVWDQSRDILDDDRLTEDDTAEDVADGAVR
ncbi:unannotated protein [freshwater metagenome]|uniref:Unannotated protein n=1 Tax=freshwater metagenome TaxID=449393 RepID=A0A6J6DV60_9ZZZZ